jgi:hypothetical protein
VDNSFLPLQFENQPKGEKNPFAKRVDSGSFSGRNDLLFGPSKYKTPTLAIQFFFIALIFVFGGGALL